MSKTIDTDTDREKKSLVGFIVILIGILCVGYVFTLFESTRIIGFVLMVFLIKVIVLLVFALISYFIIRTILEVIITISRRFIKK